MTTLFMLHQKFYTICYTVYVKTDWTQWIMINNMIPNKFLRYDRLPVSS